MRNPVSLSLLVCFTVLLTHTGYAQVDSMMNVYADRLKPEKIHIHFDKSIYNRGETIWYKVYLVQGSDTTAPTMNVYLEWYDAEGKPIMHTVAPILLSTSAGSFDIPADYQGRALQVRAFTRWMLNDDPVFAYHRELPVHTNTPKTPGAVASKTIVEAFPEGGFLVQDLHTRIAFKATNQYGNPVLIKGVLTDEANNSIDSLHIQHDGMGSFYVLPLPGQSYKLNWMDENGVQGTLAIPVTKKEGANLTIVTANGKAKFLVQRTANVPANFENMVLVAHMNRVGLYQIAINLTQKNKINAEIPLHDLPTGLLQFTLFTSDWTPVAERVVFVNNGSHAFDVKLTAPVVNLDKKAKNIVEIFVPDTLFTNMSLSITDAVANPPGQHTIFSDILLSSEIKGKVYNPGYYLSGNDDTIASHLDLVMLTNGWRRFDWDKIKAGVPPQTKHPVESGYMKLIGKVDGLKKNTIPSDMNLVVLSKDSSRQFISVALEKDGSFEHPLVIFDTAKVFFSFNNNKSLSEKAKLEIGNGLLEQEPGQATPSNPDPYAMDSRLARQKLDALLSEQEMLRKKMEETTLKEVVVTTKAKTKLELVNEKYTSGMFTGNPGRRSYAFDLTDWDNQTAASGALQFLQNRIPGLSVSCASMLDCRVVWNRAIGPPDLYVDEMPATIDMLASIPITNIALVKAFPPPFMYSSSGMRGGAIAVYTKKMEDYKQPEIKGLPSMLLAGYTKFKEFYNPSYEQPDDNFSKPDNRTTLYWSPNVITNSTQQRVRVEFFNNDFTKSFNVVLEGINAAGKMTRVVKTINADTKPD